MPATREAPPAVAAQQPRRRRRPADEPAAYSRRSAARVARAVGRGPPVVPRAQHPQRAALRAGPCARPRSGRAATRSRRRGTARTGRRPASRRRDDHAATQPTTSDDDEDGRRVGGRATRPACPRSRPGRRRSSTGRAGVGSPPWRAELRDRRLRRRTPWTTSPPGTCSASCTPRVVGRRPGHRAAARAPAGVHRRQAHRAARAAGRRRRPGDRRRPRRQDHLPRPGPAGRLPDRPAARPRAASSTTCAGSRRR